VLGRLPSTRAGWQVCLISQTAETPSSNRAKWFVSEIDECNKLQDTATPQTFSPYFCFLLRVEIAPPPESILVFFFFLIFPKAFLKSDCILSGAACQRKWRVSEIVSRDDVNVTDVLLSEVQQVLLFPWCKYLRVTYQLRGLRCSVSRCCLCFVFFSPFFSRFVCMYVCVISS
jgi:hypothetical protein